MLGVILCSSIRTMHVVGHRFVLAPNTNNLPASRQRRDLIRGRSRCDETARNRANDQDLSQLATPHRDATRVIGAQAIVYFSLGRLPFGPPAALLLRDEIRSPYSKLIS